MREFQIEHGVSPDQAYNLTMYVLAAERARAHEQVAAPRLGPSPAVSKSLALFQ